MVEQTKSTAEKISDLRNEYVRSLSARFSEMNNQFADFLESKQTELVCKLGEQSHTLCGSAGTFGFGRIAAYAKKIEELCKLLSNDMDNSHLIDGITTSLGQLEDAILKPQITDQSALLEFSPAKLPPQIGKLVYLLDDDAVFASELKNKIEKYGYQVEHFTLLDDFFNAIEDKLPEAMIIDDQLGNDCGTDALRFLNDRLSIQIPSIVMSSRFGFEERLKTVKAGADAFLSKPFDPTDLIDTLEMLIGDTFTEPYRILIVDDVNAMATYYRIVLERAGMVCKTIDQPAEVLEALAEFEPELVLMDLHMPGCRGDELAKMIHQDKTYVSLPIVYLSTETSIHEQLSALQLAGDGFLNKPIRPSQLVGTVSTRARRYRLVNRLLHNDSLTGLLNHTNLKKALGKECARASRGGQSFCYAMVDLDHFSDINNKYGHPLGDTVLKNLAWLFKQRLRKTDIVGRYGGEEFGIVMPDTDLASGQQLINEVLADFRQLNLRFINRALEVSFSAGVVMYPDYQSVDVLCKAADRLLYEAKAAGRNQVVAQRRSTDDMIVNA